MKKYVTITLNMKYPKLTTFACCCLMAYGLVATGLLGTLPITVGTTAYVSVFIAGLLFSFGFTTPFAIALFIDLAPHVEAVPAALLGGLGALLADTFIFEMARFSLSDELHRLGKHRFLQFIRNALWHKNLPHRLRQTILWSMAGLVIASPLPDEVGISLLSGVSDVKEKMFLPLCFLLNSTGILIVLTIAAS